MTIQKLSLLSSLLLASFGAVPALNAAAIGTTTYTFSGACIDCSEALGSPVTATATLVLQGYVPGTALTNSHFVSFNYAGTNLLPAFEISVALGNFELLSGNIPASLPAFADVTVVGVPTYFASFANGVWNTGATLVAVDDFGDGGTFNIAGAPTGVPEPSTVMLMGSAGLAILALRRRRQ